VDGDIHHPYRPGQAHQAPQSEGHPEAEEASLDHLLVLGEIAVEVIVEWELIHDFLFGLF
jgi:hypothetical protein